MKILKKLLPFVIVLAGIAVVVFMTMMRPKPEKEVKSVIVPFVETTSFVSGIVDMDVEATGTVKALNSVNVVSQVQGKVVAISKNMKTGGFFKKGQTLFTIDPREYNLRVQAAQAEVKRQELNLAKEEADAQVAKSEWESFSKNNPDSEPGDLVLRKPQIATAQAGLDAAKANLDLAKLNLERTVIKAPFTGRVVSKMVGKGQVVSMGMQLASIYSEELMEVEVPLNDKLLQWIDITGKNVPKALITSDFSGRKNLWKGNVRRMTAELQNKSRLPKLIIEVKRPYTTKNVPMLPNMFVNVTVSGKKLEKAFEIPSKIVRDEKIYIVKDGVLEIRSVKIEGYLKDMAIVSQGIEDGENVVISVLRDAVNGMKVRSEAQK